MKKSVANSSVFIDGYQLTTLDTLSGPWHVGTRHNKKWYIINSENGRRKFIGLVKGRGTNYYDRAREEAARRNETLRKRQKFFETYEVVSARKFYGRHATGRVLLRRGHPEYHAPTKGFSASVNTLIERLAACGVIS